MNKRIKRVIYINNIPDASKGGFAALMANWMPYFQANDITVATSLLSVLRKRMRGSAYPTDFVGTLLSIESGRIPIIIRVLSTILDGIILNIRLRTTNATSIAFALGISWLPIIIGLMAPRKVHKSFYFTDDIWFSLSKNNMWFQLRCLKFISRIVIARGSAEIALSAISLPLAGKIQKSLVSEVGVVPLPYDYTQSRPVFIEGQLKNLDFEFWLFVGSLNIYVEDSIVEFTSQLPSGSSLVLVTASRYIDAKLTVLIESGAVKLFHDMSDDEVAELARYSRGVLIPYSFALENKAMVETSFPSKLLKYIEYRKPVFVYGPTYQVISSMSYAEELVFLARRFEVRDLEKDMDTNFHKTKLVHDMSNMQKIL